jgi:glycosyltransferase involved in cell wall biosynthesis
MDIENLYINARFLTQKISGVQRFAIELSRRLKAKYPNIKFVSPKGIYHIELAKELEVIEFGILKSHLWEQIELPLFLKTKSNPLLINLCSSAPILYKNQIITIHDAIVFLHSEWFSKTFYQWYKFLLPKISQNSIKIITVSSNSRNDLSKFLNIPKEKFVLIHNAADELFVENSFINKEKIILSVSSLDPRKNFENLIKGFLHSKLDKEYQLVIVGAESASFPKHELFDQISTNKNISFTGYLSDSELIEYYQKSTLFVYPSLYEGFGIPPLEAMACGTPVITSNNSSLPEVCGDAAIFVDPKDYTQIGKALFELCQDKEKQNELITKGAQNVSRFSWDKSTEELEKLIFQLVKI